MDIIIGNSAKGKEFDFLFIYESKVRELESVCLIGQELEKRGYTTALLCWWEPLTNESFVPVKTKVLLAHAVYKNRSLMNELSYVDGLTKVINMQWEQIYSIKDLTNPNAPWKMEGLTHQIEHVSWGKINCDKLTNYDGVKQEHVHVVGSVSMDFLHPRMRRFFLSKEELFKKYHLPDDKKVCLFISSFSLVDLPDSIQDPELIELTRLSIESQKIVLDWFEEIMKTHPEILFIYRPHPAEADNMRLMEMQETYENFYSITDESVKQWILASDLIYNWFSSSLGEIYFANKGCFVLRPIQIPHDYECMIFENGEFLCDFEQFEQSLGMNHVNLPVPLKNIEDNYYYDELEPTYIKIANLCEEVLTSSNKQLEYNRKTVSYFKIQRLKSFKSTFAGKYVLRLKKIIDQYRPKTERDQNNKHYAKYVNEMSIRNATNTTEVADIVGRIRECTD